MIEKAKSGIQVESIFLENSTFRRGNIQDTPNLDDSKMEVGVDFIPHEERLNVQVTVEVSYDFASSDTFYIKVSMIGEFKRLSDFPLTDEEFANINASAIIYPYVRQHIRNISLDAGLQPILLPLVNFQKWYELSKKKH